MHRHLTVELISELFGDDPGLLPDCVVAGSGADDWSAVLDWVEAQGWAAAWQSDDGPVPLHIAKLLAEGSYTVSVHPCDGVLLNFLVDPSEVAFDFDPLEIVDAQRALALSEVISGLGRLLGHDVLIQGLDGPEFARYDVASGVFVLGAP